MAGHSTGKKHRRSGGKGMQKLHGRKSAPLEEKKRDTVVHHLSKKACNAYLAPTPGENVVAYQDTTLKWDPSCLTSYSNTMDIYLQSITLSEPIHLWHSVPLSPPSLSTSLSPVWWNSTSGQTQLQLVFVPEGEPVWAGLAPGPAFFGNWDGLVPAANASSSSGTVSAAESGYTGPSVENVTGSAEHRSSGLTGGPLAAAVLFPLLALLSLVLAYILYSRRKSSAESKRWSNYVDQRMSMVSREWTPQTATAAGMHSRAGSHATFANRASTASFGNGNGNRAGFGVPPPPPGTEMPKAPEMVQSDRRSRVSFASSPSPAGHLTHSPTPSGSSKQLSHLHVSRSSLGRFIGIQGSQSRSELGLSPDQEDGPRVLDDRAIVESRLARHLGLSPSPSPPPSTVSNASQRPRLASNGRSVSSLRYQVGVGEGLGDPAVEGAVRAILGMGLDNGADEQEAIASSHGHGPTRPPLAVVTAKSPSLDSLAHGSASGMRRLSTVRTSTMSPDEALRQYTLSRRVGSAVGSAVGGGAEVVSPVASLIGHGGGSVGGGASVIPAGENGNGGMRVLYSPHSVISNGTTSPPPVSPPANANANKHVLSAVDSNRTSSNDDHASGECDVAGDRPEEAVISRARSLSRPFRTRTNTPSTNPFSQYLVFKGEDAAEVKTVRTAGTRLTVGDRGSVYTEGSRYSDASGAVQPPPPAAGATSEGSYGYAS